MTVDNWRDVVIPLVVFLALAMVSFWLRTKLLDALRSWVARSGWTGGDALLSSVRIPALMFFLALAGMTAVQISLTSVTWVEPVGKALWTLLVVSMTLATTLLATRLAKLYLHQAKAPERLLVVMQSVVVASMFIIAILVMLAIWQIPITGEIVVVATLTLSALLAAMLFLRDVASDAVTGIQLAVRRRFNVGDYVKLDAGEEGYVTEMNWSGAKLESLQGGPVFVPRKKLSSSVMANLGHSPKSALQPFRFNTRLNLNELTGVKAKDLKELVQCLKDVPDSAIYYHTHNFLEEHQFLTPSPPNDFAVWVEEALGEKMLGELLASVDTFQFDNISALRAEFIHIIEGHLSEEKMSRVAHEGRQFHFVRSMSVVFPTQYIAHDLREFVEILRKLSINSLYYHVFEAKLRLKRGDNDFSLWIDDSLGEKGLAESLSRLNPYNYTLEDLRTIIIREVERHLLDEKMK